MLAVGVLWGAGGWYYAGQIESGAFAVPRQQASRLVPPAPAPGARTAQEVAYASELGPEPAWSYPGTSSTWAIEVHGKGAERDDVRRTVRPLTAAGLPVLAIAYRNDPGSPRSGGYAYGRTEQRDLRAAVAYAQQHGARAVVLVGASMGGAIVVAAALGGLPLPVAGMVLDAPALDLEACVELGAQQRKLPLGLSLPGALTDTAEEIASLRYGVDWADYDYLRRDRELRAPVLLFHGTADETVPVSTSDRLARDRPDLVTYVRVPGAGHVRSWDVEPQRYEADVAAFVRKVAPSD
ncbi:serine aminopeptidase S33 family [Motilibacter rhizosphaerae]|uniref:Serine aminopeptidase S33 family n=1 Tax=Motilibacter rhizosphaerae TaxID=598652 RepID=A0A4Q7NFU5_9ACTN|nr:serine aminopeptidase S33 family [Motilibacter rhizosphaerae]